MVDNILIFISGKKRHGKDYLEQELTKRLTRVHTFKFADVMKQMLADTFGITFDELEILKNEEDIRIKSDNRMIDVSMRDLLLNFSNDVMKARYGENVWADLINIELEKIGQSDCVVIIPDWRYPLEFETVCKDNKKSNRIYTIRIFNDDIEDNSTHDSEVLLDDYKFDFYVNNTGKPDITNQVNKIIYEICTGTK